MKKRILVVDDAMFMRHLITDALTKGGFEICGEADNALDAVAKYKQLKPDLITLDIVMPGMEELDGLAAVKEIVTFDPEAKVIIISSLSERTLIQRALEFGAKDFVPKPFKETILLEIVKGILC